MSNLANIVNESIQKEHKKIYYLDTTAKLILLGFCLSVLSLIISPFIKPSLPSIAGLLYTIFIFGLIVCIIFTILYVKKKPFVPEKKLEVILAIDGNLKKMGISSIEIVENLITEIENEIQQMIDAEKKYYSRIAKIFFWVLLTPGAFLTKYVIEEKILPLTDIKDYLSVMSFLLIIAVLCLIFSLSSGNIFELPHLFRKENTKRTLQYLSDLRYFYLQNDIRERSFQTVENWKNQQTDINISTNIHLPSNNQIDN